MQVSALRDIVGVAMISSCFAVSIPHDLLTTQLALHSQQVTTSKHRHATTSTSTAEDEQPIPNPISDQGGLSGSTVFSTHLPTSKRGGGGVCKHHSARHPRACASICLVLSHRGSVFCWHVRSQRAHHGGGRSTRSASWLKRCVSAAWVRVKVRGNPNMSVSKNGMWLVLG